MHEEITIDGQRYRLTSLADSIPCSSTTLDKGSRDDQREERSPGAFKPVCDEIADAAIIYFDKITGDHEIDDMRREPLSKIVQAILRHHLDNDDSTPA